MKKHVWIITGLILIVFLLYWPPVRKAMAPPLNHWAASSSVFCLEVLGYDILSKDDFRIRGELPENSIVYMNGKKSEAFTIVGTCNGLSVIAAFLIVNSLVVLLIRRPLWEKLIVLISSIPIALFCNTIRLVIFMIISPMLSNGFWKNILHDFGGYAMMPLGVALIFVELWLLRNLVIEEEPEENRDIIITAY